jgi:CheY-like chemotaxis protein/HPt (histidine-containing phosphotransfer) domain-containing protein
MLAGGGADMDNDVLLSDFQHEWLRDLPVGLAQAQALTVRLLATPVDDQQRDWLQDLSHLLEGLHWRWAAQADATALAAGTLTRVSQDFAPLPLLTATLASLAPTATLSLAADAAVPALLHGDGSRWLRCLRLEMAAWAQTDRLAVELSWRAPCVLVRVSAASPPLAADAAATRARDALCTALGGRISRGPTQLELAWPAQLSPTTLGVRDLRVCVCEGPGVVAGLLERQLAAWGVSVVTDPAVAEVVIARTSAIQNLGLPGTLPVLLLQDLPQVPAVVLDGAAVVLPVPVDPQHLHEALATVAGRALPGPSGAPLAPLRQPRSGGPWCILVVEDDPVAQQVACLQLERLGCRALVAGDGAAALAVLQQGGIDLVLLDQQLPDITGSELLPQLRAVSSQVPILAMGAGGPGGPGGLPPGHSAGCSERILKPVRLQLLRNALQRWLPARALDGGGDGTTARLLRGFGTPPGGLAALPLLDEDFVLGELLATLSGDPGFREELLHGLQSHQAALEAAVGEAALLRAAHRLAGAAASLGALRLADRCRRLERLLRACDAAGVAEARTALASLTAQTIAALSALDLAPAPASSLPTHDAGLQWQQPASPVDSPRQAL